MSTIKGKCEACGEIKSIKKQAIRIPKLGNQMAISQRMYCNPCIKKLQKELDKQNVRDNS